MTRILHKTWLPQEGYIVLTAFVFSTTKFKESILLMQCRKKRKLFSFHMQF